MDRCVVLTGGGVKGAVACARIAAEHELTLVHVDFGQPSAAAELRALNLLARSFPAARVASLELPHVARLEEQLTGSTAPRSGNEKEDQEETVVLTWAATRGLIPVFFTIGVQCAQRIGASTLVTGLSRQCDAAHLGLTGGATALDGLPESVHSFDIMIEGLLPPSSKVHLDVPLMDLSYPEIMKLAARLGVPLEATWTCERPGPQPCEKCEPCRARAQAFGEAALADPLSATVPSV